MANRALVSTSRFESFQTLPSGDAIMPPIVPSTTKGGYEVRPSTASNCLYNVAHNIDVSMSMVEQVSGYVRLAVLSLRLDLIYDMQSTILSSTGASLLL